MHSIGLAINGTLLVIRDIMSLDKRYFGNSPSGRSWLPPAEKIASNILSDHLRKLEEFDIVLRRADADNTRDDYTAKGLISCQQ